MKMLEEKNDKSQENDPDVEKPKSVSDPVETTEEDKQISVSWDSGCRVS